MYYLGRLQAATRYLSPKQQVEGEGRRKKVRTSERRVGTN